VDGLENFNEHQELTQWTSHKLPGTRAFFVKEMKGTNKQGDI
jgi:hypothetical protein